MKEKISPILMYNWQKRIGQYATTRNGRVLMKCAALLAELEGAKLHWKDKPGWSNGEIIKGQKQEYNDWFEHLNF